MDSLLTNFTIAVDFNSFSGRLSRSPPTAEPSSVVDFEFSTPVLVPDEEIDVMIKTRSFENVKHLDKGVNIVIDLFFNEVNKGRWSRSNINPTSNEQHLFPVAAPGHLKDGEYTAVLLVTQYSGEYEHQQILAHSFRTVTIQKGQKPSFSLPPTIRPEIVENSGQLSYDVVWNIVGKMETPADLCSFCRASKSIQQHCDRVFKYPFPEEFQLPSKRIKKQRPLTTLDICRFASFEEQALRYISKYHTILNGPPVDLPTPISEYKMAITELSLAKGNSGKSSKGLNPSNRNPALRFQYSPAMAWSHPNLINLFEAYYTDVFKYAILASGYVMGGSDRHGALFFHNHHHWTFEEALRKMKGMREATKHRYFKQSLAHELTFERQDGNLYMLAAESLGSTTILLERQLQRENPRVLRKWKKLWDEERVKIMDKIIEW
ncbi:hypothetical protein BKA69DRAFT_1169705 [Paraphysoderma sedebokerense]|nr:hypothetical protein BKA69DRAFT_1169705 [Paraphysoderma sedebokerense]